jgi:hypothetical protein
MPNKRKKSKKKGGWKWEGCTLVESTGLLMLGWTGLVELAG